MKVSFSLLLVFLLASCGGSETTSNTDNSNSSTPVPEPTPVATSAPNPTPEANPPASPPENMESIQVEAQLMNRRLEISWSNISADNYRILITNGNASPLVFNTFETAMVTEVNPGSYTVIVEAYDELGNSVFSNPEFVEVQ